MLDQSDLLEQIRSTMATILELDEATITDDLTQDRCGEWSSLRHMLLMVELEQCFNTELTMDEMLAMKSVPAIARVLRDRTSRPN